MKKSGTEKKRVRRGGSGGQYRTRDLEETQKKSAKDVFQMFAEKVRDNKQLESRWAILQETRVEYFRGKDFVTFLKTQHELKEVLGSDKDLEVEAIVNTLLSKNLLVRCDRVVKTLRPGKKKLSSWPKHLEIYPDQVFSENDAFFAWTFMKRRTIWQTILSFLWPLVALAMCLFPVYPYQCKIVVLYTCAGTLLFIMSLLLGKIDGLSWSSLEIITCKKDSTDNKYLSILAVRAMIFGALWIILGKSVWFFPNINAEETTFRELIRFWPKKEEGERPKWTSRLTYATVAVVAVVLLRHHAPDEAARARYQKRVSNIIDDVLEWSPRLALSGMMDTQQTVVSNATETNHSDNNSRTDNTDETSEDVNMETGTKD